MNIVVLVGLVDNVDEFSAPVDMLVRLGFLSVFS